MCYWYGSVDREWLESLLANGNRASMDRVPNQFKKMKNKNEIIPTHTR